MPTFKPWLCHSPGPRRCLAGSTVQGAFPFSSKVITLGLRQESPIHGEHMGPKHTVVMTSELGPAALSVEVSARKGVEDTEGPSGMRGVRTLTANSISFLICRANHLPERLSHKLLRLISKPSPLAPSTPSPFRFWVQGISPSPAAPRGSSTGALVVSISTCLFLPPLPEQASCCSLRSRTQAGYSVLLQISVSFPLSPQNPISSLALGWRPCPVVTISVSPQCLLLVS